MRFVPQLPSALLVAFAASNVLALPGPQNSSPADALSSSISDTVAAEDDAKVGDAREDSVEEAAEDDSIVEEEVDFDEEEEEQDAISRQIQGAAGGGSGSEGPRGAFASGGGAGMKLFVDLLVDYRLGKESFVWRPNHTYAFATAQLTSELSFIMHISDNPVFYELEWQALPDLTLKAGKMLIPFGMNNFHHIIGGRVDQESLFLPETWGDYGVSARWYALDTDYVSLDTQAYFVNGFQEGQAGPVYAAGEGAVDNNFFKGFGTRTILTLFSDYVVTASTYFDIYDADQKLKMLYYAVGLELRQGFFPVPILDKVRFRGEWARGEIERPERNLQQGILLHNFARAGIFYEGSWQFAENMYFRYRGGRVNADNTKSNEEDVWVAEPAFIWWTAKGKLQITVAYQALIEAKKDYNPELPNDVLYTKFFIQF